MLLATSAGGSNDSYTVRAIFDDAGNIIPGEDVKIDGVKVGTVGSVTPTPQAKAAVVLNINNPGFQDFRADASCTVRPQALIGEKYVDCLPTQPRVEGTPLPPPLQKIPHGHEGAGQYLLPVQNTHSPVDVDLLGDISRLPERQRLTIILNELGAGLAGRGSDLNEVIRRANPALQEFDKVLAILAGENHVLAKLAVDSDTRSRRSRACASSVADFIVQSNKVAQASAAHARRAGAQPQRLPAVPANSSARRWNASAASPNRRRRCSPNLGIAAPGDRQGLHEPAGVLEQLDHVLRKPRQDRQAVRPGDSSPRKPLLARLKPLGSAPSRSPDNLASLLASLRDTGGLERLMDFIFLGAGAANGYDSLGHFLRTEGVGNTCLKYAAIKASQRRLQPAHSFNTGAATSAAAARIDLRRREPQGL